MAINLQLRGEILRDLEVFGILSRNNTTIAAISGDIVLTYDSDRYHSFEVKGSITESEFNEVLESLEGKFNVTKRKQVKETYFFDWGTGLRVIIKSN